MHNKTIAELARGLKAREFSSEELTLAFLKRIERFDGQLNSFITITPEIALAQAIEADTLLADGRGGPLTGVPSTRRPEASIGVPANTSVARHAPTASKFSNAKPSGSITP